MIYFGVPLRSEGASKNWQEVTRIFNRTLASIYGQTDSEFRIVVACHEIPELYREYDSRVEFVQSKTIVPKDRQEMMLDKGWKLSLIAQKIREYGGGYTMIVDSDDLISNRIAEYVHKHPGENGFISHYGYVYNEGYSYLKKMDSLYRICGSCSIVNYRVEDLPAQMPQDIWDNSVMNKCIIRMPHNCVPDYMRKTGRRMSYLPFPSTIYLRNTGDNHSMLGGSDLSKKRKLELMLRRKIQIDTKLKEEFGL